MIWAVVVLLSLLGTLLIVIIIALMKYFQLARIQHAIEHAWYDDGICNGRDVELDCRLHYRDDLTYLPVKLVNSAFDASIARRLSDYVARVEMATENIPVPTNHIEVDKYTPAIGPTFGVAWKYEEDILIIAFRATVTHHEIQEDLMAWQVNFDTGEPFIEKRPQDTDTVSTDDINGTETLVHSGFYKLLLRYRNDILNTISKHTPKIIYLCGHSLGGAVATLMSLTIAEFIENKTDSRVQSVHNVVCYVYGTPRIGNNHLDQRVRNASYLTSMWRIVNLADNIQDLPLHVTPNFKRPSNNVFYYEHAGPAHTYYSNWGTWRTNHFLPNYMNYLQMIQE